MFHKTYICNIYFLVHCIILLSNLGLGQGVDFTFNCDNNKNNNNKNPHLNFLKGTVRGDKEQGVGIRDKGQGSNDKGQEIRGEG